MADITTIQQVEYGIVHRNLKNSNISATPVRPRPSLDFARGRANIQLGEFVDGPYNKFPTVKIPETRRVYDKFHAYF
jgi:hypothetical protein